MPKTSPGDLSIAELMACEDSWQEFHTPSPLNPAYARRAHTHAWRKARDYYTKGLSDAD